MGDRLLAATRKGLFTLERGGDGRWEIARAAFLGDNVPMVLPDRRDGSLLAALDHGHFGTKMHRSADGGATWEESAPPAYAPLGPDEPAEVDGFGKTIPLRVERVWALEGGGASRPGRLWCGTIPGGLFRSDDGGASWSLVQSLWDHPGRKNWMGGGADLPGIHSISVHPDDPDRVTVGVSCGGVWETRDGGASWEPRASGMFAEYMPPDRREDPTIQDPHRVVRCPASPDHLWAQHHNGIFRSTDGAASWREVGSAAPSSFGFAVAVHPTDPDRAWFVPGVKDECRIPPDGRLVVTRTRDGGASFEALGRGLPQRHAYHVVYRHALDVDDSGERLAFGSTTGSLWTSDDQGDSWSLASADLPPVYCVRFAPRDAA